MLSRENTRFSFFCMNSGTYLSHGWKKTGNIHYRSHYVQIIGFLNYTIPGTTPDIFEFFLRLIPCYSSVFYQ